MCVLISLQPLSGISHSKKNSARHYHKRTYVFKKRTRYSGQILIKLEYATYMLAKSSNFMEIRPAGAELIHAGGRTDTQTDMTKLIVAFRSFANAPKNKHVSINVKYTLFLALSASGANAPDQLRYSNHFITFLYFQKQRVCINWNNAMVIRIKIYYISQTQHLLLLLLLLCGMSDKWHVSVFSYFN
jgi:hypothetical protein